MAPPPEVRDLVTKLPTVIYASPLSLEVQASDLMQVFKAKMAKITTVPQGGQCARIAFKSSLQAAKWVAKSMKVWIRSNTLPSNPVLEWSQFDLEGQPQPLPISNLLIKHLPTTWENIEDFKDKFPKVTQVRKVNSHPREPGERFLVRFESVEDAVAAWERMSGVKLEGGGGVPLAFEFALSKAMKPDDNPLAHHMHLLNGERLGPPVPGSRDRDEYPNYSHHREASSFPSTAAPAPPGHGMGAPTTAHPPNTAVGPAPVPAPHPHPGPAVVVKPPQPPPAPAVDSPELASIEHQVRAMLALPAPEPGSTVIFKGLSHAMSEFFVYRVCGVFGCIEKVVKSTPDTAVVTFSKAYEADNCVRRLNGTTVGETVWSISVPAPAAAARPVIPGAVAATPPMMGYPPMAPLPPTP